MYCILIMVISKVWESFLLIYSENLCLKRGENM